MKNKIDKINYSLILFLPFFIITGPAIPDIVITLIGLSFLYFLFFYNYFNNIFYYRWVLFSFIFWLFLLIISFFSENTYLAYRDSIIFIRILLIPVFIYFWILVELIIGQTSH